MAPTVRAQMRHGSGGSWNTDSPNASVSSAWPSSRDVSQSPLHACTFHPARAPAQTLFVTVSATVRSPSWRTRNAMPAWTSGPSNELQVTQDWASTTGGSSLDHQTDRRFAPRFDCGALTTTRFWAAS